MDPSAVIAVLACGALLVRAGQLLVAIGTTGSKNAASAVARGLLDIAVTALAFWGIGAAIAFQSSNGVFGIDARWFLGRGGAQPILMTLPAILIAPAIVTAATGERSRLIVSLAVSVTLAILLVPICGTWTGLFETVGWLSRLGFRDSAGAAPLHLVGAVTAIVAAKLIGARNGKYHADGSASMIPAHNVPLVAIGSTLMLLGWLPYVAMLTRASGDPELAALNALLAAAAGACAAAALSQQFYGKVDVLLIVAGLIGGLVSSTAAGGATPSWAAVTGGAITGALMPTMLVAVDLRLRIDDVGGLVAPHLTGAVIGLIFAGAVETGGPLHRLGAIGIQLLGVVVVAAFALAVISGLMLALRATVGIRSNEADEFDGLDLADHDVNAYPDFQQNMIKSYHLREV